MFNLGFTMEELMFPENYQTDSLNDKYKEISPIENYQEQIIFEEEDDDDWFTIKQLNPDICSNDHLNDQILPLNHVLSHNSNSNQIQSMVELDGTNTTLILPNLLIKLSRDKNNTSSSSIDDHQLLKLNTINPQQQQQSTKYAMSKSTSSLSFCTQSSTSITSSSADDMSHNSTDFNELLLTHHHSTDSFQKLSHKHHSSYSNDNLINDSNRRRRKRTIFSTNDIEYLKEAFIQNPKPTQQDIAVLSEQLGHDSYVIRVWFYNKRQSTKKRN